MKLFDVSTIHSPTSRAHLQFTTTMNRNLITVNNPAYNMNAECTSCTKTSTLAALTFYWQSFFTERKKGYHRNIGTIFYYWIWALGSQNLASGWYEHALLATSCGAELKCLTRTQVHVDPRRHMTQRRSSVRCQSPGQQWRCSIRWCMTSR